MKTASTTVLANAALLVVYFAAAKFGLSFFALIHPSASPVWLPTGIALAGLLLGGLRLVPALFAGAFLANVTTAGTVASSLGVGAGNTLEAVLAATLVERFAGGRAAFTSPARILKFMVLGALLSPMVSATIGVTSLCVGALQPWSAASKLWAVWWLGDTMGALVVAPALLVWTHRLTSLRAVGRLEAEERCLGDHASNHE